MAATPDPADRSPAARGWKRQPLAMWAFLAIGVGRIVLTGIGLVVFRRRP